MLQTLEKRRETKRKSVTERRIQHIKKISNEKAGMNLKRKKKKKKKGKVVGILLKLRKVIFFLLFIFEVHGSRRYNLVNYENILVVSVFQRFKSRVQ